MVHSRARKLPKHLPQGGTIKAVVVSGMKFTLRNQLKHDTLTAVVIAFFLEIPVAVWHLSLSCVTRVATFMNERLIYNNSCHAF